jgi:metallo-beta-lactamase class B
MVREVSMKSYAIGLATVAALVIGGLTAGGLVAAPPSGTVGAVGAQSGTDTAEAHVAIARAAAGQEHTGLFSVICVPEPPAPPPAAGQPPAAKPQGPPARSTWYAPPVKVFDNLYYVGEKGVSSWAVTTSAGIILIDTVFSHSVEDEVVAGLEKLGLDPKQIKYAIVTHGHDDHFSGAKYLQDRFGAHIVVSEEDWGLIEKAPPQPKPRRDIVATDGQTITLGDTTLTLYLTPGHTAGTVSVIIPVKDHGQPHVAVEWGGSSFAWVGRRESLYVTKERTSQWWFETFSHSAERMRDIAAKAGADIVLGNHAIFDGSDKKLPAMATRKPGDPHPYVIGSDSVKRYFTVADECAKAGLLRMKEK